MAINWNGTVRRLLPLAAIGIAPLVAHDAVAQQVDPMLVAEGAAVYGANCGRCHNARSPLERSDRQWVVIMTHMRVRANLAGQDARKVLAFLMATNGQPSPGQAATAPMDGEADRLVAAEETAATDRYGGRTAGDAVGRASSPR